jgi:selenocysteine lyase/cysteine desulfurase
MTNWQDEWFSFGDAVYMDVAAQGPMTRAAIEAVGRSLEAKQTPHRYSDASYFEAPNRARASLARLVGGRPEEIALTTGASAGATAIANGLQWHAGDEVITSAGEFPLQYTTWGPLAERERVSLRVVAPSGRFLTADDVVAAITPRTKLVSLSLVRFDDGSLLDAPTVAAACHAHGALLCLDVSQCCGALPIDVAALGADFLTSAGYKWLLSPYGTGFFWMNLNHLDRFRPGPFYWLAMEGAENFSALNLSDPKPSRSARRWDAPEWASAFNMNLAGFDASLAWVERARPDVVRTHNAGLIDRMYARMPTDVVEAASPLDAARRGPFGCLQAGTAERTRTLYDALRRQHIVVSLRQGKIRVSPHLFNTEADIDRLVDVIANA